MKIAVFSNDVIPGMSMPVAAPGLRAWGLTLGLRAHGHDVSILVDARVIPRAWNRGIPPPMPRQALPLHPRDLETYVATHSIDALVITNSNPITWLTDNLRCLLVYDFFAPKMLELEQSLFGFEPEIIEERTTGLAARKERGLQRADAVIVNGKKKIPYVQEWLKRSGVPDTPCEVVNMAIPPTVSQSEGTSPLNMVISGYIQPWSQPGPWIEEVIPFLDNGSLRIHLLVGNHWGGGKEYNLPDVFSTLLGHENVTRHGVVEFKKFRSLLTKCDISVDIFARNRERELAMVTRSIVALSCGIPVVHVPFTEVSDLISQSQAGWLVDEQDPMAVADIITAIAQDDGLLADRKAGAWKVANTAIEPSVAIEPLVGMLETFS